ncbi:hypothetical protein [Sedimentitalea todarodis]|uniref:Uncharacterized protein n=1 Tax=Sedimentitalea todarodis TaxID=1631240 RepID=A0ABU3VHW7_9RHOB|nr:hypothetical protein [Sedimentitalea todarodis]MDU9005771.1 hypothetical protein [Sedimentitalea todarodis]
MALRFVLIVFLIVALPAQAGTDRGPFLDMARKGWVYELRSAMWPRAADMPPIRINGRDMAGSVLCLIGEPPHPQTLQVLQGFAALMHEVFGKPLPLRFADTGLAACGTGRIVFLRLYSGATPHGALNDDLRRMDLSYGIGFPKGRNQWVLSPAQAQTFFGRNGMATHMLVKQSRQAVPTALEQKFFASILIEELYQSFTFGMDILHFDLQARFLSKLEEAPINLRNLAWDSPRFMQGLLRSNPARLCPFDVFMLHALARSPVEQTNSPEFLSFIETRFDDLEQLAGATVARAEHALIVDSACTSN